VTHQSKVIVVWGLAHTEVTPREYTCLEVDILSLVLLIVLLLICTFE